MSKKLTTKEFISKSIVVHGNKYGFINSSIKSTKKL